ncbi:MAG: OmpA family protein [Bacteroidota bacterium]
MKPHLLLLAFLLCALNLNAQSEDFTMDDFRLGGDAVQVGDQCFRLTSAREWQGGTVWYQSPVDLNDRFEMELDLKFGCKDEGADGIVFIFHDKLRLGRPGEGMGFSGLYPSLGIEMDTYQNYHLDDPAYDHIALMKNGRIHHQWGQTAPKPILQSGKNIEDCKAHRVKVTWNPTNTTLAIAVDGQLRIEEKYDLVQEVFRGNPNVYWGFSAATGGKHNTHQVCLEKLTFTEAFAFDTATKKDLLKGKSYTLKNIDFPSGKTTLPTESSAELDRIVTLLKSKPHLQIQINGHTDSSGGATQNKVLSQKRADAVAKYLMEKGIPANRIISKGHGEAYPKFDNLTSKGRVQNRRVDVFLFDPRA